MSHFLRNLIARHQLDGLDRKASRIVQPRPKSRFENDDAAASSSSPEDLTTGAIAAGTRGASAHGPQNPPGPDTQPRPDRSGQHSDARVRRTKRGRDTDPVKTNAEAIATRPDRPRARETSVGATQSTHFQATADRPEALPKTAVSGADVPLTSDRLGIRIQTVLQRLNRQLGVRGGHSMPSETLQETAKTKSVHEAATRPEERRPGPGAVQVFAPAVRTETGADEERSSPQQSPPAVGLLQTPEWLTEIQTGISTPRREQDDRPESDPVINVTIGRVEVKAVQTHSAKPVRSSQQTDRIMSLDDYLQRRNREQQ